jgi:DNA-binding transcriptional LysR family regulator
MAIHPEEMAALLALFEYGSLNRAADETGIARSTLRRRVEALEARSGARLYTRGPSGLEMTEAGAVLAERGKVLLAEARALLGHVHEVSAGKAGPVRVSLPPGLPLDLMTAYAAVLQSRHPLLQLHYTVRQDPLAPRVTDFDIGVFLGKAPPAGPWVVEILNEVVEWLVASKAYLDKRGTPASLDDLHDHPLLSYSGPDCDPERLPTRSGADVHVKPVMTSPDIHWLRHCAQAGLGIARIPDARLPDPPGGPPLIPVLVEEVGRPLFSFALVPRVVADLPRIRIALEEFRALFARLRAIR